MRDGRTHLVAWLVALTVAGAAGGALAGPCGTDAAAATAQLHPLPHEGRWGFVGKDGEWRLAPRWQQVRPFSEGRAAVQTGDGWGVIDHDGRYVVEPGARDADRVVVDGTAHALSPYKPAAQGCIAATPAGGTPHYLTVDGTRWDPPALAGRDVRDLGSFSEGLAWVRVARDGDTAVGWIDTAGEMAIAPRFHDGGDFADGRAPAAIDPDSRAYIDTAGDPVFPHKFLFVRAGPYADDRAPVTFDGQTGYMGPEDWEIERIVMPDGTEERIAAAAPFSAGLATVHPDTPMISDLAVIDSSGKVAFRARHCAVAGLPLFRDGLLPVVQPDDGARCPRGDTIAFEGPGDARGAARTLPWILPGEGLRLLWHDTSGNAVIDSGACRRPPGMAPLAATEQDGSLAAGGYTMSVHGDLAGTPPPARADHPCNRSLFRMADNTATNAKGPWLVRLQGAGRWQDKPVGLSLAIELPRGAAPGPYPVGEEGDTVQANLWVGRADGAGPEAPRPPSFTRATGGEFTLEKRDAASASGHGRIELANLEDPDRTVTVEVRFERIPYRMGAEVELIETTGAVTALDEAMPDDPLINFFTPASAREGDGTVTLALGEFGPKLELTLPADHSGAFTAGPDAAGTVTFAGQPVVAQGTLERADGRLSGRVTARLGSHSQVEGAGSVTLRFAHVPLDATD
ncbi:WG repeat-containing protein [Roseovarius salinarum]|uniref:WG repeat-containing protein n=1 Tax=Roseovarius salinarum TaxID=1981892 RepID=UPI000C3489DF|nr:WG repeat-containing protein [Roseovarius salinarum]